MNARMNAPANYTPLEGSKTWKVIEFFTTYPAERLIPSQLAEKFDMPTKQWHSTLSCAVQIGMLVRTENEDGEIEYSLGTGCPEIAPNKAAHPSLRANDALLRGSTLFKVDKPKRRAQIDLHALVLQDDVPLPDKRNGLEWAKLLARMKVGQSCCLPDFGMASLGKAMTNYKRVSKRSFERRRIGPDEIRLWRVK